MQPPEALPGDRWRAMAAAQRVQVLARALKRNRKAAAGLAAAAAQVEACLQDAAAAPLGRASVGAAAPPPLGALEAALAHAEAALCRRAPLGALGRLLQSPVVRSDMRRAAAAIEVALQSHLPAAAPHSGRAARGGTRSASPPPADASSDGGGGGSCDDDDDGLFAALTGALTGSQLAAGAGGGGWPPAAPALAAAPKRSRTTECHFVPHVALVLPQALREPPAGGSPEAAGVAAAAGLGCESCSQDCAASLAALQLYAMTICSESEMLQAVSDASDSRRRSAEVRASASAASGGGGAAGAGGSSPGRAPLPRQRTLEPPSMPSLAEDEA
jgi:hypothetical protein